MYRLKSGSTEGIRRVDMSRGMITSTDTIKQVSIKFRTKKKVNKNMGVNIEHNTHNTYRNGEKCVRMLKRREKRIHVYAGSQINFPRLTFLKVSSITFRCLNLTSFVK